MGAIFLVGVFAYLVGLTTAAVTKPKILGTFAVAGIPLTVAAMFLFRKEFLVDLRNWRSGALGEEKVGALLENLIVDGFSVLHDVEFGHGNIDHVMIGPNGVFIVETKSTKKRFYFTQAGRLMVGNKGADDIRRQVIGEAIEVRRRLESAGIKTWVEALVVLTASKLPKGPIELDYLRIIEASDVINVVRSQNKRRLSPDEVQVAHDAVLRARPTVPQRRQT